MAFLLIDIGNSNTKVCVFDSKVYGDVVRFSTQSFEQSISQISSYLQVTINKVIIVSVASDDKTKIIIDVLNNIFSCEVKIIITELSRNKVRCGYHDIKTLGADRWVAIVAAYQYLQNIEIARPVMIIDSGTVITVDLVDKMGKHYGGWMMPGTHLMTQGLVSQSKGIQYGMSADLLSKTKQIDVNQIGRSTTECISTGVSLAHAGFIEQCYSKSEAIVKNTPYCIVTGGGADMLMQCVTIPLDFKPDLVVHGLTIFSE